MKRSERSRLGRTSLDFRYAHGGREALADRPVRGWIRAVRDALGMTSQQLADRMEISQPAVAQLERSELAGGIQIDSLRRAAAAMNCDLVYAIVPRTSLETIVRDRALSVSRRDVAAADEMMQIDQRGLTPSALNRRTEEYANEVIASGRLWDERDQ